MIPSEVYRELEAQILEQLRDMDREQFLYLVGDHDLDIELLTGEWMQLFAEAKDEYYRVLDLDQFRARMAVSPDELEDFVAFLKDEDRKKRLEPISFGIAELEDALPQGMDLVGVVFAEESDDWMWVEQPYEIMSIRPEVFELLEPHMRRLIERNDHALLARLCADHCEGSVEFSAEKWELFLQHIDEKVPELRGIVDNIYSQPADYTSIHEAMALVSDPRFQPSLDAWLRVHAGDAQFALYFRDTARERQ
jgi:hypothetical protein